jgi:uncharacterized protein (DUF1778 family)
MTVQVRLSSETEAKIREQIGLSGQDLESFILQAVAEKLTGAQPISTQPTRNGTE